MLLYKQAVIARWEVQDTMSSIPTATAANNAQRLDSSETRHTKSMAAHVVLQLSSQQQHKLYSSCAVC